MDRNPYAGTWLLKATSKVFRESGEPAEGRTDGRGEMPCPDLDRGPVWPLAQVLDKAPGRRDGKDDSEVRYEATLALGPGVAGGASAVAECLARVREVHGAAGLLIGMAGRLPAGRNVSAPVGQALGQRPRLVTAVGVGLGIGQARPDASRLSFRTGRHRLGGATIRSTFPLTPHPFGVGESVVPDPALLAE